jgi:hypothetical protein
MDDMNAFEHLIASVVQQTTRPPRPVDVMSIVRITTTQSPKSRFQAMFSVTKFIVAGVIVALFGGLLLSGVLTTRQGEDATPVVGATLSPQTTTEQPVMLPSEIPEGIDTGSLDTPLGPARWVSLRGDETTLPLTLNPVPVRSGGFATLDSGRLWRSPDLITWSSEPMPIKGGDVQLSLADGTNWLRTIEPASLWRSPDTLEWSEVSLDGLTPPGPDGYVWRLFLVQAPLAYDGVTIVPYHFQAETRGTFLGLAGERFARGVELTETGPGVYDVRFERGGPPQTTIRIEETSDGLRVIDDQDGTDLTVLDGISMDFIDRWASRDGIPGVDGLGIVDGDQLVGVDLPDLLGQAPWPTLLVDESGFASYVLGPDEFVHVYRSTDGRDWIESDIIGDDPGEPTDIVYVQGYGSVGSVVIESEPHTTEWTSADGVVWESRRLLENFIGGDPFASGWLWIQEVGEETPWKPRRQADEDTMWYMPKDGEPVAIDISEGYPMPVFSGAGSGGSGGLVSSNTVIRTFQADEGANRRWIWIITFDEVPA